MLATKNNVPPRVKPRPPPLRKRPVRWGAGPGAGLMLVSHQPRRAMAPQGRAAFFSIVVARAASTTNSACAGEGISRRLAVGPAAGVFRIFFGARRGLRPCCGRCADGKPKQPLARLFVGIITLHADTALLGEVSAARYQDRAICGIRVRSPPSSTANRRQPWSGCAAAVGNAAGGNHRAESAGQSNQGRRLVEGDTVVARAGALAARGRSGADVASADAK